MTISSFCLCQLSQFHEAIVLGFCVRYGDSSKIRPPFLTDPTKCSLSKCGKFPAAVWCMKQQFRQITSNTEFPSQDGQKEPRKAQVCLSAPFAIWYHPPQPHFGAFFATLNIYCSWQVFKFFLSLGLLSKITLACFLGTC